MSFDSFNAESGLLFFLGQKIWPCRSIVQFAQMSLYKICGETFSHQVEAMFVCYGKNISEEWDKKEKIDDKIVK